MTKSIIFCAVFPMFLGASVLSPNLISELLSFTPNIFAFTPNFSTELSSFAGYFLRGLFTLSATSSTGILSFFPQFRL